MKKQKRNTGINLESRVFEQQEKEQTGRIFVLVPVFYMILGVYGWIRTALGIGAISCRQDLLYVVLLLMGLWFGGIYAVKRWQLALFALSVGAAGVFVWRNFELIKEGFIQLGEIFWLNMSTETGSFSGMGFENEITLAVIVFVFLMYCVFIGCLNAETGKYLVAVFMVIPVSAAFIVGQIPDGIGVFCMIFSTIGLNVSSAEERDALGGKIGLLTGMLGLLLLAGGFAASEPVLGPLFEKKDETRERIQQTSLLREMTRMSLQWQKNSSTVASGGVSDGTFNNTDFFRNTGEVLFSVAQSEHPESNLYLRVYTGAEYTTSQWKENKDNNPAAEIFYGRAAAAAYMNGFGSPVSLSVGFPEGKSDEKHAYAPYFSQYQGETDGMKQYVYYPMWYLGEMFSVPADESTEDYKDYVYKNYLDYPAKRLPRLKEFVETHPCADLEEICSTVRNLLSENASYNPQVGRFPEDEDFAEYFLFEQKEGYCVHFATAAVLLMRMYKVPARYVTGFAVPPSDFEWEDGIGWLANVKDGRAHAWAEIYVDNYGWIPFETTPSYDAGASLAYDAEAQQKLQMESESSSEKDTHKQSSDNKDENQSQSERGNKNDGSKVGDRGNDKSGREGLAGSAGIGATGIVLVLLVFAVLILFVRREVIVKRRGRQGAAEIFRDMYQVLVQGGMPKTLDCMAGDFTEKVTEQFLWIDKEELDYVMDIVMRANFSDERITKEEVLQVRSMYRHICRTVLKGMSWQKKIYFRFVKAYA